MRPTSTSASALALALASTIAACQSIPAANPLGLAATWVDADSAPEKGCGAFESVAPAADGTWLSGPRCALYIPHDGTVPKRFDLAAAADGLAHIDAAAADGNDLWLLGRRRQGAAEQSTMGLLRAGRIAVAPPSAWGLGDVRLTSLASARPGVLWAAGERGAPGHMALARYGDSRWSELDVTALAGVRLEDIDVTDDGCTWAIGRGNGPAGVLVRFDGQSLRQENVDPVTPVAGLVAGVSCGDVWIGRDTAVRYAHGHREEIEFGPSASLTGMSLCPDGDLLLVGRRQAETGAVGFSFRVHDGAAHSVDVQVPFVAQEWELRDVACGTDGAWAVGHARRGGATPPAGLVYRLEGDVWAPQPWAVD